MKNKCKCAILFLTIYERSLTLSRKLVRYVLFLSKIYSLYVATNNWRTEPMKLTKTHIVDTIQNQLGLSKKQSTQSVETILEILKDTLASGEDILISNFGKFCVKEKAERKGRKPATGEALMLKQRKIVTFRVSDKLREKINE